MDPSCTRKRRKPHDDDDGPHLPSLASHAHMPNATKAEFGEGIGPPNVPDSHSTTTKPV